MGDDQSKYRGTKKFACALFTYNTNTSMHINKFENTFPQNHKSTLNTTTKLGE